MVTTSSVELATIYGDDEPPPSLARYARDLWARRSLLTYLTRTRLKGQHYDTTFGKAWLVLGPLMMAGVYMLARSVMQPPGTEAHARMVIAHIVMGVFIFQYVATGITSGASSVLANSRMLLNTPVPCGVFPTTSLMGGVVTLIPTLIVLLVVRAFLRQPFGISLIAVPVIILLLTAFIYGVSLALAALTVYFRDTTNFLTYLTRLWLFVTPVIYTVNEIPEHLRGYLALNPLYPYYAALDDALSAEWPSQHYLAWAAAWALAALIVGLAVFLAKERDLPSDSDDIAIRVEDLRITYQTWVEAEPTLVRSVQDLRRRTKSTQTVNAVQGVSFEVPRGSVLGMIGPNGSGKSTILRALAGILRPSSGRITLHGRVTPLLSLGVGFNFQLSGYENIKLGGLLAGMEAAEIRERTPEIIEFSGLGDAINRPIRTYSNGMFTRLAFSVAVFLDPEIILIDELLAAGDAEFRFRSADKIRSLMDDDTTVVFVSHTFGEIKWLSDWCLWLEDGAVVQEGDPDTVVDAYAEHHGVQQPELAAAEDDGALGYVWRGDGPGPEGSAASSPSSS